MPGRTALSAGRYSRPLSTASLNSRGVRPVSFLKTELNADFDTVDLLHVQHRSGKRKGNAKP